MARFVAGAMFGMIVTVVGGAALGLRAQEVDETVEDAPPIPAEVQVAAIRAGVDARALHGAVVTTGAPSAVAYLQNEGMLERPAPPSSPPPPPRDPVLAPSPGVRTSLVDCIIYRESRGNPNAVNPRSGASGLGQFLPSTWRTTPQGRAGYSVFDPAANRAAVSWMVAVGRGREFVTIGGC